MSRIRGRDFDKTVIIPPEENAPKQHKTMASRPFTHVEAMGGLVEGPPKGLSRWGVFFLIVLAVLIGVGIVVLRQ